MEKNNLDRRVQRTRSSLQDALIALTLEKGYETITVQDILDRANVGRSTFYSHFIDKEALLLSEFEKLHADLEQHMSQKDGKNLLDFSLIMFQHARHYHNIYRAVVGKQSGQLMQEHLQRYLYAIVLKKIEDREVKQTHDSTLMDIIVHHITHSFMTLLIWWLDHNLPYSVERMDAIYRQLIQSGISGLELDLVVS